VVGSKCAFRKKIAEAAESGGRSVSLTALLPLSASLFFPLWFWLIDRESLDAEHCLCNLIIMSFKGLSTNQSANLHKRDKFVALACRL